MENWEVENISELSDIEERKYLEELLAKYEKELRYQKMANKNYGSSARSLIGHRIAFLASSIGMIVSCIGSTGDIKIDAIIKIASAFTFFGAVTGTLFSGFKTSTDIKEYLNAAKYAKEEMNELKAKIKNVKKQIRKA